MKTIKKSYLSILFIAFCALTSACQDTKKGDEIIDDVVNDDIDNNTDYKIPNIDLSNWKVTLPIGNPSEVEPPQILNYATNEVLKPFMYNDSIKGALVFYTYPESSTPNSSYSRTELREQMVSGSNNTNWTFSQGGTMKGELAMGEITKDANDDYHRTIIMQIHGRLTNEQRDLIGQNDNNAPPMLKIYWVRGKVRVKTKKLINLGATETEMLETSAWTDDDGYTFPEYVGFDKFTLEVRVSEGRMEVIMNGNSKVYEDIHMQKWGIFENYFKAGNYLVTLDDWAKSKVEYYSLELIH